MRLKITHTLWGSIDGIQLNDFVKGLTYDVGTNLGCYLLAQGWAEPTGDVKPLQAADDSLTVKRKPRRIPPLRKAR